MADIFPLLEEEQWDEALLLLDQIKGLEKATDTDLAQMWYYYAYGIFLKIILGLQNTITNNF